MEDIKTPSQYEVTLGINPKVILTEVEMVPFNSNKKLKFKTLKEDILEEIQQYICKFLKATPVKKQDDGAIMWIAENDRFKAGVQYSSKVPVLLLTSKSYLLRNKHTYRYKMAPHGQRAFRRLVRSMPPKTFGDTSGKVWYHNVGDGNNPYR